MAIETRSESQRAHSVRVAKHIRHSGKTGWLMGMVSVLAMLLSPVDTWAALSGGDLDLSRNNDRHRDERALLGWATHLSRYATDVRLPQIRYEPHRFFVENACRGRRDCRVVGWYDDRDIVYVDATLSAMDTLFERSLLVHELVHVLQHRSGEFNEHDCKRFVEREREAYAVQQAFFVAHGAIPTISARHFTCQADVIEAAIGIDKKDSASSVALARQAYTREDVIADAPTTDTVCPAGATACHAESSAPLEDPPGSVQ